jgi:dolichol-phosphate mannosyltransferase
MTDVASRARTVSDGARGWRPSVAVVVPTYREAENLAHLAERLGKVRESSGLDIRVLLMDDDSRDGSDELVRSLGLPWMEMVVRTGDRGLSQAVLDGLRRCEAEVLVVMDADLSHPPETIPRMVEELGAGADVVVGSRFTEGGSTDDDWGPLRWVNSRVATLLARPLTRLKDPMSGFFALRRSTFAAGRDLNPVGYKIGLELIIKCHATKAVEIPIRFADRRYGTSKLSLKEQLKYLQHLRRLYIYRFGTWVHLAQFLVVGLTGLFVNLALLTLLLRVAVPHHPAIVLAIAGSMVWNFVLNRRFSFSYARKEPVLRQFLGFVVACSVGAVVNYGTTVATWDLFRYKQLAAAVGVAAGTAFNFVASRFVVFRRRHGRRRAPSEEGGRPGS